MSGSLATMVGMLARAVVWLMKRDARLNNARHGFESECMCEHCQWVRGIEFEADEKLGSGWRP